MPRWKGGLGGRVAGGHRQAGIVRADVDGRQCAAQPGDRRRPVLRGAWVVMRVVPHTRLPSLSRPDSSPDSSPGLPLLRIGMYSRQRNRPLRRGGGGCHAPRLVGRINARAREASMAVPMHTLLVSALAEHGSRVQGDASSHPTSCRHAVNVSTTRPQHADLLPCQPLPHTHTRTHTRTHTHEGQDA